MSDWISREEVNGFLLRIKRAVSTGRYHFVERQKNIESLSSVGLLPNHVKDFILGLKFSDYFNGPEDEENKMFPPGKLIYFGISIGGREFIIKVKLVDSDGEDFCICISFHVASNRIIYPYKR